MGAQDATTIRESNLFNNLRVPTGSGNELA